MNRRAIRDITAFIFMEDQLRSSDVILVPGTSQAAVTERAAALYRAGLAPWVLPSGRFSPKVGRFARENIDDPRYDGDFQTDFDYCRNILRKNGVPDRAILREDRAMNSMENAKYSAEALEAAGIAPKTAILCCQAFHARRAFLSYARYLPETELLVAPVETQGVTAENWYRSREGYRRVMGELAKCGRYFMEFDGGKGLEIREKL